MKVLELKIEKFKQGCQLFVLTECYTILSVYRKCRKLLWAKLLGIRWENFHGALRLK